MFATSLLQALLTDFTKKARRRYQPEVTIWIVYESKSTGKCRMTVIETLPASISIDVQCIWILGAALFAPTRRNCLRILWLLAVFDGTMAESPPQSEAPADSPELFSNRRLVCGLRFSLDTEHRLPMALPNMFECGPDEPGHLI